MRSIILAGLFAFLISLIYFMPLSFVAPYLFPKNSNIIAQEPSGTIWSGKVGHLTVNKHYLGKVDWVFSPIKSLMSLSIKANFTIKSDDINIEGIAGIGFSKKIAIDNTRFTINSRYINTLQRNVKLSGNFNGLIETALIEKNIVPEIDGVINWENGGVDTPFVELEEGNYKATLTNEAEDLKIQLSSSDAPIELNGNIKVQPEWTHITSLTMKSENKGLMTAIRLGLSGKAQNDGSVLINQRGDLKPFIGLTN